MQLKTVLITLGTLTLAASPTLGRVVTPANSAIRPEKRNTDDTLRLIVDNHLSVDYQMDVVGYDGRLKGRKSAAYTWIGLKHGETRAVP